jgi:hypothetical protein
VAEFESDLSAATREVKVAKAKGRLRGKHRALASGRIRMPSQLANLEPCEPRGRHGDEQLAGNVPGSASDEDGGLDVSKARIRPESSGTETSVRSAELRQRRARRVVCANRWRRGWRAEGTEGGGPLFTSSTVLPT